MRGVAAPRDEEAVFPVWRREAESSPFALQDLVLAFVLPPGQCELIRILGRVMGRTREGRPRYDVRANDGTFYCDLPESALEAMPSSPAEISIEGPISTYVF